MKFIATHIGPPDHWLFKVTEVEVRENSWSKKENFIYLEFWTCMLNGMACVA